VESANYLLYGGVNCWFNAYRVIKSVSFLFNTKGASCLYYNTIDQNSVPLWCAFKNSTAEPDRLVMQFDGNSVA
jgi:hypothetical protein